MPHEIKLNFYGLHIGDIVMALPAIKALEKLGKKVVVHAPKKYHQYFDVTGISLREGQEGILAPLPYNRQASYTMVAGTLWCGACEGRDTVREP